MMKFFLLCFLFAVVISEDKVTTTPQESVEPKILRDEERDVFPATPVTGERSCGEEGMCAKSAPLETPEDLGSRKSRSTHISGNSSPEEDDYEEEEE